MGFEDRIYVLIVFGIPVFFVLQTLVLAVAPFRMNTADLAIQVLGLGMLWMYSVYHVLMHQGYLDAMYGVVADG